MSAAQEAAAALAPVMAAELVEAMPLAGDDALKADLAARQDDEAAPRGPFGPSAAPSSQTQPAPAAAPPAAPAVPAEESEVVLDFEPQLPDDLQALLDEPDFEEEAALEVGDEQEDWNEDATDPETAKKLKTLEKRNAWLESRNVAIERKRWVSENLKAYPLLNRYAPEDVASITATSRRGFARQAASLNERLAKMVQPALTEIAEAKKTLRGEVVQEVRAEYKQGWGEITVGPGVVPVEAAAYEAEMRAAKESGQLHKVIGVMMKAAGVNRGGGA